MPQHTISHLNTPDPTLLLILPSQTLSICTVYCRPVSMVGVSKQARAAGRHDGSMLYLSVSLGVDGTYVGLQHGVVLLLGAQTLLQHRDVLLVVLVLLLERLHLGGHLQDLLLPPRDLQPQILDL